MECRGVEFFSFVSAWDIINVVEMPANLRPRSQSARTFERLFFLLVSLALIFNVAGRYTQVVHSFGAYSVVTGSAQVEQQHLNADALAWAPPPSEFVPFLSAVSTVALPESDPPYLALLLEDSLSNRPPPSC